MPDAKVYGDYDQAALDAQYNNRARFPDYQEQFDRWRAWSDATRARLPCQLDVAFGPSAMERLDIFPAEGGGAPLYLFIHGGYWMSLDKADNSFVADGMRPHGIATAVSNYGLAPDHDMDEIVRQNRAALAWLWRHAAEYGADPSRIYVAGHSAGGHLATMLLATDWPAFEAGLPPHIVKGVCSIGGLFDLEPVRRIATNATIGLTPEQVRRYSPLHQEFPVAAPLLLVVGEKESAEFHRQSRVMHERWQALGYPGALVTPAGRDHFDVLNELRQPDAPLVRRQRDQMPW